MLYNRYSCAVCHFAIYGCENVYAEFIVEATATVFVCVSKPYLLIGFIFENIAHLYSKENT